MQGPGGRRKEREGTLLFHPVPIPSDGALCHSPEWKGERGEGAEHAQCDNSNSRSLLESQAKCQAPSVSLFFLEAGIIISSPILYRRKLRLGTLMTRVLSNAARSKLWSVGLRASLTAFYCSPESLVSGGGGVGRVSTTYSKTGSLWLFPTDRLLEGLWG